MWGGVFSSVDCLLIYYRQKDDPWNAVAAGFITGGVLAIRGNPITHSNLLYRRNKCCFQERSYGRSDIGSDRRSVHNRDFNCNEEAVPDDGGDAKGRT